MTSYIETIVEKYKINPDLIVDLGGGYWWINDVGVRWPHFDPTRPNSLPKMCSAILSLRHRDYADYTNQLAVKCIVSDDKELIFSRFGYDFKWSMDKSVAVDGGFDSYSSRVIGEIHNESVWLFPHVDGETIRYEIIDSTAASFYNVNCNSYLR